MDRKQDYHTDVQKSYNDGDGPILVYGTRRRRQKKDKQQRHLFVLVVVIAAISLNLCRLLVVVDAVNAGISSPEGGGSSSKNSIPRSTNSRHSLTQRNANLLMGDDCDNFPHVYHPPWNPSKRIDRDGYLLHLYRCIPGEWEQECSVGGRYSDLRKKTKFLFARLMRRHDNSKNNYNEQLSNTQTMKRHQHDKIPLGGGGGTNVKKGSSSSSETSSSSTTTFLPRKKHLLRSTTTTSDDENDVNLLQYEELQQQPLDPYEEKRRRQQVKHDQVDQESEYLMCQIRQVPGDGNCLFHSVSTCLSEVQNSTRMDMVNTTHLAQHSAWLRHLAVDCLRSTNRPRRLLFLQGRECLRAHELVEAAAAQYNITPKEYCDLMSQESYWGGGPEIVALCNVLKRPIHVYELATVDRGYGGTSRSGHAYSKESSSSSSSLSSSKTALQPQQFVLRRMACFGSPKFDRKEPLHILSADSRFPDLYPGKQLSSGNHFMALFPYRNSQTK